MTSSVREDTSPSLACGSYACEVCFIICSDMCNTISQRCAALYAWLRRQCGFAVPNSSENIDNLSGLSIEYLTPCFMSSDALHRYCMTHTPTAQLAQMLKDMPNAYESVIKSSKVWPTFMLELSFNAYNAEEMFREAFELLQSKMVARHSVLPSANNLISEAVLKIPVPLSDIWIDAMLSAQISHDNLDHPVCAYNTSATNYQHDDNSSVYSVETISSLALVRTIQKHPITNAVISDAYVQSPQNIGSDIGAHDSAVSLPQPTRGNAFSSHMSCESVMTIASEDQLDREVSSSTSIEQIWGDLANKQCAKTDGEIFAAKLRTYNPSTLENGATIEARGATTSRRSISQSDPSQLSAASHTRRTPQFTDIKRVRHVNPNKSEHSMLLVHEAGGATSGRIVRSRRSSVNDTKSRKIPPSLQSSSSPRSRPLCRRKRSLSPHVQTPASRRTLYPLKVEQPPKPQTTVQYHNSDDMLCNVMDNKISSRMTEEVNLSASASILDFGSRTSVANDSMKSVPMRSSDDTKTDTSRSRSSEDQGAAARANIVITSLVEDEAVPERAMSPNKDVVDQEYQQTPQGQFTLRISAASTGGSSSNRRESSTTQSSICTVEESVATLMDNSENYTQNSENYASSDEATKK